MSGRFGDAAYANVNKTGKQARSAGSGGGTKSGVAVGGGAIDFPEGNAPHPDVSYFGRAKAMQKERRYRKDPY